MDLNSSTTLITLAGALGTASMGIVETAKRLLPWVATLGRKRLLTVMGPGAMIALESAYGTGTAVMVDAAFRQSDEELSRVLRNGVKVGFTTCNAEQKKVVAAAFGQDADRLVRALAIDPELPDQEPALREARQALSQFEMAVDTRIAAAVASSSDVYAGWMQLAAGITAFGLAIGGWACTGHQSEDLAQAVMLGIVAVPIAPIANDIAGALKTAASAFRRRSE